MLECSGNVCGFFRILYKEKCSCLHRRKIAPRVNVGSIVFSGVGYQGGCSVTAPAVICEVIWDLNIWYSWRNIKNPAKGPVVGKGY